MTTKTTTAGQQLTATLRRYFSVGPRTRRFRKTNDLHRDMIEAICYAATLPGYYTGNTQQDLRAGWAAYLSYNKHIAGYRVDGALISHINGLTPWHFAALLGRMADAGITNVGEGETFFNNMARQLHTANTDTAPKAASAVTPEIEPTPEATMTQTATTTTPRQTFLFPTGQSLYTGTVVDNSAGYLTLTGARRTGWADWEIPTPGEPEDVDLSVMGATVLGGLSVVWLEDGDLGWRDFPQDLTDEAATDRDKLLARLRTDDQVVILTADHTPADDVDPGSLAYADTLEPGTLLHTLHLAETIACPACIAPAGQPCRMGGFGGTQHPRRALAVRDMPADEARDAIARLFTARRAAIAAL